MASKRRNMFYQNKKQETTEIDQKDIGPAICSRSNANATAVNYKSESVTNGIVVQVYFYRRKGGRTKIGRRLEPNLAEKFGLEAEKGPRAVISREFRGSEELVEAMPNSDNDDLDHVDKMLKKTGCTELHYRVQVIDVNPPAIQTRGVPNGVQRISPCPTRTPRVEHFKYPNLHSASFSKVYGDLPEGNSGNRRGGRAQNRYHKFRVTAERLH
ncbi:hypothetical protein AAG570_001981 [Ranatra chinensis]|uniref:Uncharacterized protein n=1 Tax=Ranatra chinensis TaxID=642074 RepID=A0ABD0YA42_9HEMI